MRRAFLTAEWRNLAMLNYVVDPALLMPFVPKGTVLDTWHGRTYVSLVGFMFVDTRVLGVPIPFHRTFEEVNLRFYVRRTVDGEVRRAVTFLRELVPRRAIAFVAQLGYNEPYTALPMRHEVAPGSVTYEWMLRDRWCGLRVETTGAPRAIEPGSEEEFITEHYWGYTRQRDGSTVEYQVVHPSWIVSAVSRSAVIGDLTELYGDAFAARLCEPPHSAFLADGSAISVSLPKRLTSDEL
ncbi:MAG: hypothetical protein JWL61_1299 [Gemmatimonadetes bacterium]|nr:hypothetical protein [Gemmatimonadota bacterium]